MLTVTVIATADFVVAAVLLLLFLCYQLFLVLLFVAVDDGKKQSPVQYLTVTIHNDFIIKQNPGVFLERISQPSIHSNVLYTLKYWSSSIISLSDLVVNDYRVCVLVIIFLIQTIM